MEHPVEDETQNFYNNSGVMWTDHRHRNYIQIGKDIRHGLKKSSVPFYFSSFKVGQPLIPPFASREHDEIGESVEKQDPNVADFKWCTQNGVWLTLGETIALAGDFYGIPESPIVAIDHESDSSGERSRFMAAYETLDLASKEELEKLVTMLRSGKDYSDKEWDEAVGGKWIGGVPVRFGRMLKLAKKNYDHFMPQAKRAYLIGHRLAREKAREAGTHTGTSQQDLLSKAYSLDAFACHFLTDSFSSGHIRTPRVELSKYGNHGQGDLLSKFMHDEDCKFGLRVTNANGSEWISFGDNYLLKDCSKANFDLVKKAVQVSIDEVHNAYSDPFTVDLDYSVVPYLIPSVDIEENNNTPLFQVKDGKVLKRSKVKDLQGKKTTDSWQVATTLVQLKTYSPGNSAIPTCT